MNLPLISLALRWICQKYESIPLASSCSVPPSWDQLYSICNVASKSSSARQISAFHVCLCSPAPPSGVPGPHFFFFLFNWIPLVASCQPMPTELSAPPTSVSTHQSRPPTSHWPVWPHRRSASRWKTRRRWWRRWRGAQCGTLRASCSCASGRSERWRDTVGGKTQTRHYHGLSQSQAAALIPDENLVLME